MVPFFWRTLIHYINFEPILSPAGSLINELNICDICSFCISMTISLEYFGKLYFDTLLPSIRVTLYKSLYFSIFISSSVKWD